jgi:radical SAM-linked protein
MQRVFIRAGIGIKHTSGFNPHPYIAFALPLSVGTSSVCELMDFEITDDTPLERVPELVNPKMPEGITILSAYKAERKFKDLKWLSVKCELTFDKGISESDFDKINNLYHSDELQIEKRSKRGTATVDIIPLIHDINLECNSENLITITATISAQEPSLSPATLVSAIDQKLPELTPDFTTFQRLQVLDKDYKVFR